MYVRFATITRYIFLCCSLVAFVSCSDEKDGVKFEITNNASVTADSVYVQPNRDFNYVSVKPGETIKYYTSMKGGAMVDVSYLLTYKLGHDKKFKDFGYFTNGNPLDELFKINIYDDTVLISSILKKSLY